MKPVAIDFAARRMQSRPALLALALVAAGLTMAASDYVLERQRLTAVEAQLAQAQAESARRGGAPREAGFGLPVAQVESINRAVLRLNLPWREILDSLEAKTSRDLALLSVEPQGGVRQIRIQAEARDSRAMLAFVEALQQDPLFAAVTPLRHEIVENDPDHPYRFAIDLLWKERP